MAKGTESKQKIFKKLQEIFQDSFWEDENKILRIPLFENGDVVEIKVTLTAAKTNLKDNMEAPNGFATFSVSTATVNASPTAEPLLFTPSVEQEPTEEEKQNVENLIKALGL